MARRKVGIGDLSEIIKYTLRTYGTDVQEDVDKAVKKVASAARTTLKNTSPRGKRKLTWRKHYAENWAISMNNGRLRTTGIVYNKKPTYRVTHLLEHGHAKRNGGRVRPIVHIAPVEQAVISQFTREVEKSV